MWFSVISGCFFGSKRGRLRAHALRRGGLSASVPTLTRRLLGLTFILLSHPQGSATAWLALGYCTFAPLSGAFEFRSPSVRRTALKKGLGIARAKYR